MVILQWQPWYFNKQIQYTFRSDGKRLLPHVIVNTPRPPVMLGTREKEEGEEAPEEHQNTIRLYIQATLWCPAILLWYHPVR